MPATGGQGAQQATATVTSSAPAVPTGPTVRVTRGKDTVETPVGRGVGALLDRQARGVGAAGRTAPLGLSTLR